MKVRGSALFRQGIGLKLSNRFSPLSINLTSPEPRPIPCHPGSQLGPAHPGGDGLCCAGGLLRGAQLMPPCHRRGGAECSKPNPSPGHCSRMGRCRLELLQERFNPQRRGAALGGSWAGAAAPSQQRWAESRSCPGWVRPPSESQLATAGGNTETQPGQQLPSLEATIKTILKENKHFSSNA